MVHSQFHELEVSDLQYFFTASLLIIWTSAAQAFLRRLAWSYTVQIQVTKKLSDERFKSANNR